MTYLISRADYERCVAGMSDHDRTWFDLHFAVYPDRDTPDVTVDTDLIADRFLDLQSAEAPDYRTAGVYWSWSAGRQFGKLARARDEQDRAQRWPPDFDAIDPDQPGWYGGPSWLPAETLVEDITYDGGTKTARRYFLNQWTPQQENPITHDDVRRWADLLSQRRRPPRNRITAGKVAYQAFLLLAQPRRGWPKDLTASAAHLAHLADIPIVADPELADTEWKLIDTGNDRVLYAGELTGPLADQARAACSPNSQA